MPPTRSGWTRRRTAFIVALAASVAVAAPPGPGRCSARHGRRRPRRLDPRLRLVRATQYPRGFDHFDYVNPAAPKGGTLYLRNPDRRSSFDKFNYFTTKGVAPAGIYIFMLEPLAVLSADEPQTMYGLLAEEMLVAPDKSAVTFRIHPQARFYNGDPVTAADVKYSFDSMSGSRRRRRQTALAGSSAPS